MIFHTVIFVNIGINYDYGKHVLIKTGYTILKWCDAQFTTFKIRKYNYCKHNSPEK